MLTINNCTFSLIDISADAKLQLTAGGDNIIAPSDYNHAAIHVPLDAELVITEDSTGYLTANAYGEYSAGIGTDGNENCGKITINGGNIKAESRSVWDSGSGIGGIGADITINGGNINITTGTFGTAIGCGVGYQGSVKITGGNISVSGGSRAYSIQGTSVIISPGNCCKIEATSSVNSTDVIESVLYGEERNVSLRFTDISNIYMYEVKSHSNEDNDHQCDVCKKPTGECVDENEDLICDICNESCNIVFYNTEDEKARIFVRFPGTYTAIFADYNESGSLENIEIAEMTVTLETVGTIIDLPITKGFSLDTDDKVMIWNNHTDLVPLCEAYIVK